jgi:ATP-dependent Clp protease protease subunit
MGKDWLEEEIRKQGIILLAGGIDIEMAERVCGEIIAYNKKEEVDRIQMIVNSPGGDCSAGFAIIDMMEWSQLPVYTSGIGEIASMGLMVFMTGERGKRMITPRTSILSHRFSGRTGGNHSQLVACRKEQDMVHERIVRHYLDYTSVGTREELENTLLQPVDSWLSPEDALRYGIADIVEPMRANRNRKETREGGPCI